MALTDEIWDRAAELASRSLSFEDGLHVASAEAMGANVLLTFDGRLVRGTVACGILAVEVVHAVAWLEEKFRDKQSS